MHSPDTRCRVYDSTAIDTMGWAFDKALEDLSEGPNCQPNVRLNLALSVMRFFDEGESNPLQLYRMALAVNAFSGRKRANNSSIVRIPSGFERGPIAF
jgi:hypothetical protein